jgi:hypothetical protein
MIQTNPVFTPSRAKVYEAVCHTGVYYRSIHENIEIAQMTFRSGFENGDIFFGAHGPFHLSILNLLAGMQLDEYSSQVHEHVQILEKLGQTTFAVWTSIYLQSAVNFIESSEDPQRLSGTYLNEDEFLRAAEENNDVTGRHFIYAPKLLLAYHFGVDNRLLDLIHEGEAFIGGAPGMITLALTQYYSALSWLRLYPSLSAEKQKKALYQVEKSLSMLEIWSKSEPVTFQHWYDLTKAEKARVFGETDDALHYYSQAINSTSSLSQPACH